MGLPFVSKAQTALSHTSSVGHVSSTFFSIFCPPTVAMQLLDGGPSLNNRGSKFNQLFVCRHVLENFIKLTALVFIAADFVVSSFRFLEDEESFRTLRRLRWTQGFVALEPRHGTAALRVDCLFEARL